MSGAIKTKMTEADEQKAREECNKQLDIHQKNNNRKRWVVSYLLCVYGLVWKRDYKLIIKLPFIASLLLCWLAFYNSQAKKKHHCY